MKADIMATTAITTAIIPISSGEKRLLLLVVGVGANVGATPLEDCTGLSVGVGEGVAVGAGVGVEPE